MAGSLGENYVLQILDASLSPSALATIACQGDLSFDTGSALQVSRTKGCKNPFFTETGFTATTTVELSTPIDSTHTAILDAADAKTELSCAVITSDIGLPTWTGNAFVTWAPLAAPVEGIATISVSVAWVNDPTRGAAA